MIASEFDKLEVGSKFRFGHTEYTVEDVERYMKEPGKYDVHSVTVDGGFRVKKSDDIVTHFALVTE